MGLGSETCPVSSQQSGKSGEGSFEERALINFFPSLKSHGYIAFVAEPKVIC
jgi:hypothetical protein